MTQVFTWPVGCAVQRESGLPKTAAPFGSVGVYVTATTAGGALSGFLLGELGRSLQAAAAPVDWLLPGLCLGLAAFSIYLELRGRVRPLPQRRAQVPRGWLGWRHRALTAWAYGLLIGSGALTYLEHAVAYALLAILFLAPSAAVAVALGALYGLARGLALLITWFVNSRLHREIRWTWLIEARRLVNGILAATALVAIAGIGIVDASIGVV